MCHLKEKTFTIEYTRTVLELEVLEQQSTSVLVLEVLEQQSHFFCFYYTLKSFEFEIKR